MSSVVQFGIFSLFLVFFFWGDSRGGSVVSDVAQFWGFKLVFLRSDTVVGRFGIVIFGLDTVVGRFKIRRPRRLDIPILFSI